MPVMTEAQEAGWHALMDLYEACPQGWALVGGQLVHLWCAERQTFVARPTDDADAVLDVREHPDIHYRATAVLQGMGFTAETTSEGVQHRWVKGKAVIDLLIPRHLGEVASNKAGAGGGRTIATPGAQKVLNRTEVVHVRVATAWAGSRDRRCLERSLEKRPRIRSRSTVTAIGTSVTSWCWRACFSPRMSEWT